MTVWATSDSIHRLPRAEPGEFVVAHPVTLTGRFVYICLSNRSLWFLFSYTGCVGYESIDERMVLVIPKGAVAKDPRPAPGSVLPKDATDLKVTFFSNAQS